MFNGRGEVNRKCEKRPILYESTKKAYKDAARRDDAWKEVAEELGEVVTGLYCESSNTH